MITKLLGVTPTDTLHQQTAMETVSSYVTRRASKFYFKNQSSDNEQTIQLGQFNSTRDKYKMPRNLWAGQPPCTAKRCNSEQTTPHNNKNNL